MPQIAPWFPEGKFGVFIHWLLAHGDLETGQATPKTQEEWRQIYRRNVQRYKAENFNAREWARMFKDWGATYAVLTTKHHAGLALYDFKDSPFSVMKDTPIKRDLVREYADALREAGIKVGLYYSLPDWSHPDYPSIAAGGDPEKTNPRKNSLVDDPARWHRFLEFMFAEVRHLLTAYGKIDLMWFDGDWERSTEQWHSVELAEMIEKLQPGIVLNNRLRHICLGHYGTPEQAIPLSSPQGWWEQCMTLGWQWEYEKTDTDFKPVSELVRTFGDIIGMGGNLLLNIGPKSDGTIQPGQADRMAGLGKWIKDHAEAVYGTAAGLPHGLFNGSSTHRGGILYLIAYDQPRPELVVKGIASRIVRATHLRTGTPLAHRASGGRKQFDKPGWQFITLPAELMDEHATVVKLEFENDVLTVDQPGGGSVTWRGRPVMDEMTTYNERLK
jgi:alpha-L-fucosidase